MMCSAPSRGSRAPQLALRFRLGVGKERNLPFCLHRKTHERESAKRRVEGVVPNLKPYRQHESTVGADCQCRRTLHSKRAGTASASIRRCRTWSQFIQPWAYLRRVLSFRVGAARNYFTARYRGRENIPCCKPLSAEFLALVIGLEYGCHSRLSSAEDASAAARLSKNTLIPHQTFLRFSTS